MRWTMIGCAPLLFAALTGCPGAQRDLPNVQASSDAPRDTDVRITADLRFAPACTVIREGQTVEWWVDPDAPAVAVNVTSLGTPVELFSPSLVPPATCAADASGPARICWRHTFAAPGCYPYYDTNSGSPGRPVVDDYYGTVSFIGESGDVQKGLVCVAGDGTSCDGVCCNANFDCRAGFVCQTGRCVRASDREPSPCPAPPQPDAGVSADAAVGADAQTLDASAD